MMKIMLILLVMMKMRMTVIMMMMLVGGASLVYVSLHEALHHIQNRLITSGDNRKLQALENFFEKTIINLNI